jgi:hypothetical protein
MNFSFVIIGDGKPVFHIFHCWSQWEMADKLVTDIPIGALYPTEVRGKAFTRTQSYQRRQCTVCGRYQVRPL